MLVFKRSDGDRGLLKMGAPSDEDYTRICNAVHEAFGLQYVGRVKGWLRYPEPQLLRFAKLWEMSKNV